MGRNLAGQPDYPCRINAVPRPIPEKKWFMEPGVIILLGGVLPFASIFIEMYVTLYSIRNCKSGGFFATQLFKKRNWNECNNSATSQIVASQLLS